MDLQTEKTLAKLLEEFEIAAHSMGYKTACSFPTKLLVEQKHAVDRARHAIFKLLSSPKQ